MGKDKNIYDPTNDESNKVHGHFCLRCKFHYLCIEDKCLIKERSTLDPEDKTLYFQTREELVDVTNCHYCESLSDATCKAIKKVVPSFHFGNNDKKLASVGLFKPD